MLPQLGALPFMPFGGGPGSVVGGGGSEFGHGDFMGMQQTPGMMPFPSSNSVYGMGGMGMGMGGPMFGGASGQGSQVGGYPPMMPPQPTGMRQNRMSTFSLATSVNPFAGPSMNPNPSDDELFNALRNYLSTQDLMTVTKK